MNDHNHIHPDFREVCTLPAQARIAFMKRRRWIGYPIALQALETLRSLMEKPARRCMPNLLLVGQPRNGKSAIIRRFFDLHGQGYVNEEIDPVKPVIVAKAPPKAGERSLYNSILECFWTPHRASDPIAKLRYQAVNQLRYCHTRMLIIDDFHLLLNGTAVKRHEAMNAGKPP